MKALRMMFLGVTAEARKHTDLLARAKPATFTEEDGAAILRIAKRGFQMKFLLFLSASSAFYLTPGFIPLVHPLLTKSAAFFLTYRCLSVPVYMRTERQFKEISEKYQLETHPELIMTKEEIEAMWLEVKKGYKPKDSEKKEENTLESQGEKQPETEEKTEKQPESHTSKSSSSDSKPTNS